MAGILEHPEAVSLLEQASLSPGQVAVCSGRLSGFLARYLPLFRRQEQRQNASLVIQGKLSGLERKTSEPIAISAGVHRKPLQSFVGWGPWDDESVMDHLRLHVKEQWHDPQAVLVIDPSSFPKKGTQSCGVQRQWCGRLGKVENCQVGVFLFYSSCRHGHAGIDRRLFLPREWAGDPRRRAKAHVPETVVYQERWEMALGMVDRCASEGLAHAWVCADSEFGRVAEFRSGLRKREERYLLDVPEATQVRDLDEEVQQPARRHGSPRKAPWRSVKGWAEEQPAWRWRTFLVRDGEMGPLVEEAVTTRAQTMQDHRVGPEERLVVTRSESDRSQVWYRLAGPGEDLDLKEAVRAGSERHRAEQALQEGKGEVGLGHYEVRRWDGWHHHMTLSLLALWFLALERARVGGGKDRGGRGGGGGGGAGSAADGLAAAPGVHAPAEEAGARPGADSPGGQPRAAA